MRNLMNNINIKGTFARDCDVILDAPADAKISIENTNADRVKTVYKIRDSENLKSKILEAVVEGTPPEVIDNFITALNKLDAKSDVSQVELSAYRSGITKYLKPTFEVAKFTLDVFKEASQYF